MGLKCGLKTVDLVVAVGLPGDCACGGLMAAERDRTQRCRRRMGNVLTSRECETVLDVIEVCSYGFRYLCMGDGNRFQFEVFESPVAAGRGGSQEGSHVGAGSHVCVRCLRSECDVLLPRSLLAHRSRSLRDRDLSPVLRICMETTRANLLWQAAAVRPEPERMPSLRCCADLRSCIARVWDSSCFVILTNGAASRA